MVRTELMGGHTHDTTAGVRVNIWSRDGKYLARGSFRGQRFGETLGSGVAEANARLRRLLTEIEDGSFLRPSEARQRPLSRGQVPRLTLRQLIDEYLDDRRRLRGRDTAATYCARLMPVLDFAERSAIRQRWPLASSIDREFALKLRAYLHEEHKTTRNGRAGGAPKLLSPRQVRNILECLRTMLGWARKADVHKLPADWANPLSEDVIGKLPRKDPLREDTLPLEKRITLVSDMDLWQLCQLSLLLTLPMRPDEATGLLISDVDWDKGWLKFGTRLGGSDFNKGRQNFVVPFPDELRPLLRHCIGDRTEGPLLRRRTAFSTRPPGSVSSFRELEQLFEAKLARAPRGSVLAEQDRKQVFRALLCDLGGVSGDQLAREFRDLLSGHGWDGEARLYTLRHAVTTAMHRTPDMSHLELRYMTGHATNDILSEYVSLQPVEAMRRYFVTIRPLLDAIVDRARQVGLP